MFTLLTPFTSFYHKVTKSRFCGCNRCKPHPYKAGRGRIHACPNGTSFVVSWFRFVKRRGRREEGGETRLQEQRRTTLGWLGRWGRQKHRFELGVSVLYARSQVVEARLLCALLSKDFNNEPNMPAHKVSIVGSGNWGSAIARIIGENVKKFDTFDQNVRMYVYEEIVDGRKLTEIINMQHENVKYLPGYKLPENVVAVPDIVAACDDADVLVFVLPHKFIVPTCKPLVGKVKPGAIGLSLVKGFAIATGGGGVELISNVIHKLLNIEVCVLMGANLAGEVADQKFCETTIGCRDPHNGLLLKRLIQTDYFRVTVVDDIPTIEVCGALKNIVAVGAGFVDGLGYGDNTKAAVIRLGLMEMIAFADTFYPGAKLSTFFESCGVADLVTTCYGGRNRRVAEAFVKANKSIEELEREMLNGQKLQGPETAEEVFTMLKDKNMLDRFPLFVAIHRICSHEIAPSEMIQCIKNHPEHMNPERDIASNL